MATESSPSHLCNPFAADIFPDGDGPEDATLTLHHEALEELENLVDQASAEPSVSVKQRNGRVVLLRAPRAGYGKSHLLSRLQHRREASAVVVAAEFDPEQPIAWKPLLDQVLEALHQTVPGQSVSTLDIVARRLFGRINAGLLRSGKIPCPQPEEAAAAVDERFLELFDFSKPGQPVTAWFLEHFERLLTEGARVVQGETGLSPGAATTWLRALCGYAQAGAEEDPGRLGGLLWALRQPESASPSSAGGGMKFFQAVPDNDQFHKEKLGELCRLTAAWQPLVILLDHLDGFHGSSEKVLRLANFISDWRELSGRTRFILSVNQDLWNQTFLQALPSALEDRLTSSQISLGGISREAAGELIRSRLEAARVPEPAAVRFIEALSLPQYFVQGAGKLISPRAVLRHAARTWTEYWKSPPAEPGDEDPPVPVAKMRDMLDKLRERITPPARPEEWKVRNGATTASPAPPPLPPTASGSSGAILPDPVPATPRTPAAGSPFLTSRTAGPDHPLQVRFHTLRAHFASSPWLLLDQDRLYHLMKLSGQRLAVVRFLETGLPGLPEAVAGVWQSPDAEILFGSEPFEDRKYWSSLIDFARQRSSYVPGSRLVMFSSASAPVNLGVWMHQDEIVAARGRFLDLQTLDHATLAALYATDEVLRESERGALPLGSADAFSAMAPQLEALWKRLTRPLRAVTV